MQCESSSHDENGSPMRVTSTDMTPLSTWEEGAKGVKRVPRARVRTGALVEASNNTQLSCAAELVFLFSCSTFVLLTIQRLNLRRKKAGETHE